MARGGYGQANRFLRACKLQIVIRKVDFTVGTWKGHSVPGVASQIGLGS
jgi:hypothetical protein